MGNDITCEPIWRDVKGKHGIPVALIVVTERGPYNEYDKTLTKLTEEISVLKRGIKELELSETQFAEILSESEIKHQTTMEASLVMYWFKEGSS